MVDESPPQTGTLNRSLRVAAALVLAVQLWLIVGHAPWFDEAQAVLVAHAPWADLLTNLRYEGHPALWYLLLGALDRIAGLEYALRIAELLVAAALTALIWLRSPFPTWVKFLLTLNYYFFFEYGVVSRSYGLAAALILAAVAFRHSVWGWVLLALAANVAAHFTAATACVAGLMFLERRNWTGAAIYVAACFAAVATVYPAPPDIHLASPILASLDIRILINLHRLSSAILPDVPLPPLAWARILPFPWSIAVSIAALVAGTWMLRGWPAKLGFLGLFSVLWAIGVVVYPLSPRHVGALVIYVIAAKWIEADREPQRAPSRLFVAWLLCLAFCGVVAGASSIVKPFTRYPEVARWIVAHQLQGEALGGWPGNYGSPLALLLDRPLINTQKGCAEMFTRWNYDPQDESEPLKRIRASGARFVVSDEILPARPLVHFGPSLVGRPLTIYDFGSTSRASIACGTH